MRYYKWYTNVSKVNFPFMRINKGKYEVYERESNSWIKPDDCFLNIETFKNYWKKTTKKFIFTELL